MVERDDIPQPEGASVRVVRRPARGPSRAAGLGDYSGLLRCARSDSRVPHLVASVSWLWPETLAARTDRGRKRRKSGRRNI
jgi:hypothetical protein